MSSFKISFFMVLTLGVMAQKGLCELPLNQDTIPKTIIKLPRKLPKPDKQGIFYHETKDSKVPLTINDDIQKRLNRYIRNHGNPLSAIVIVDVQTGRILAMAQGKDPHTWGSDHHTALYQGFPAASLFKVVPALAALDFGQIDSHSIIGLKGGCSKVHPRGGWLKDVRPNRFHKMTLSRAFASSCNSFFAKLTLQYLGVGVINSYAQKLGWNEKIPADFEVRSSPLNFPAPSKSALHTVGRYAAGFGMVGISPIHAAWMNLVIARDGAYIPLKIIENEPETLMAESAPSVNHMVLDSRSTYKLRQLMRGTVRYGTAASAFRPWKYRKIRKKAGGKTGTLTSQAPKGKATWFAGMMPVDKPQVIVSAIVVNGARWVIKGSHLAAEGFRLWEKYKKKDVTIVPVSNKSIPESSKKTNL